MDKTVLLAAPQSDGSGILQGIAGVSTQCQPFASILQMLMSR